MSQAIYRKYRPSTFADVSGQGHVKKTIQNQVASDKVAHAYLFTGPRGVGKTTIARLIAKTVNCLEPKESEPCNACEACKEVMSGSSLDVFEIDAASHTDVENVRENIIKSVRFAPNKWKFKVYIIDEVHMLSTSSFNALLKTLEEPPAHAIFILATTEIHKVPQTIISRCQRFDFKRIPVPEIVARLQMIAKDEKVDVANDVLQEISRHADGCARDAETLLGQVLALGEKTIGMDEASLVLPATTHLMVLDFIEKLIRGRAGETVSLLNNYCEQGIDLRHFVDDTIEMIRTILLAVVGKDEAPFEVYDDATKQRLVGFGSETSADWLLRAIDELLVARRSMKSDKIPQLSVELAIMKICQPGGGEVPAQAQAPAPTPAPKKPTEPEKPKNDPPSEPPVEPKKEEEVETVKSDKKEAPQENVKEEEVKEEIPVVDQVVVEEAAQKDGGTVELPVIKLEDVQRKWKKVFDELKTIHASLPLVVQTGNVTNVTGDVVELSFDYEFYADTMNQEKNRVIVEKILKKVFGAPLRIRARYQQAEADEAAAALVEEFGGSVV